jgi:glucan biosynthesis protein C
MEMRVADQQRRRHFGMDWLRIGAFVLLILYHVGMAFVPWPYELKVAAPQDWIAVPMLATNAWRLTLLFVVSGYASGALLARTATIGRFARERLSRLGLPLLAGMVLLNTPQPWVALATQHGYQHGFGWFLTHDYYDFKFIDGVAMPTWMHLWFVVYLIIYTLVLAALAWSAGVWRARLTVAGERVLAGPLLLPLPILWIWGARLILPPGWIETHGLFDDWSAHAVYLAAFLFGVLLRRSEPLMRSISAQWRWSAALGLLAYAVVVLAERTWPGNTPIPDVWRPWFNLVRSTQAWATIVALIGVADRYLTFDHRWRAMLAEAVFPFYLIHQTIILVVGYWLLRTATGPGVRFVALVLATASGCWLFYLLARRSGPLRPFFGLARKAKCPRDPIASSLVARQS